jgi:lycopene cyclase domain-containing protein
MYHIYYLLILLATLGCLGVLDRRFKLAVFYDAVRTVKTIGIAVLVFAVWDLAGIDAGIFRVGNSAYVSGLRLAPEFPVEEIFFLTVLVYSALLLVRAGDKLWPRI